MKNFKIGLITAVMGLSLITSCKKLDLFPANGISLDQAFTSVNDAKAWDNGIYSTFRSRQYGIYMFSTDIQADQLNAGLDFGNRNGNPHRWDTFLSDDYTIRDTWSGYYYAIRDVNVALGGYPTVPTPTPADVTAMNVYKGNAYFARAYYYFQLVNRFAKAYNPLTAATDLGVPLVLTYDVNARPARASVAAVYTQIQTDLGQAKTLLAGITGAQGANTFTIDAVNALDARVKLFKHDWAGAYTAANALITSAKYPLYTTATGLTNYWLNDAKQEDIMQCLVIKPNELPNTNSVYLGLIPATSRFTPDFIPSQWVVDAYAAADLRKGVYFASKPCTIQGASYTLTLVNKYAGNQTLFTGATTNYAQAPKVFRIAEMYLIAAEAAANNGSDANAIAALDALRAARGLAGASSSGAQLKQDIKDERFRELAFEGFRLDDLKRWNLGFTRSAPQNLNTITVAASNYNVLSIAAGNNKFVWGIPANDITINTNLEQNTGW